MSPASRTRDGRSRTGTTGVEDWPDFAQFFFGEMFPEPHSTKQREDCVEWSMRAGARGDDPGRATTRRRTSGSEPETVGRVCEAVRCPVLVITGSLDKCQNPVAQPDRLAEITGGELVIIEGGGHLPQARDPVKVNLLLRDFVRRVSGPARQPHFVSPLRA